MTPSPSRSQSLQFPRLDSGRRRGAGGTAGDEGTGGRRAHGRRPKHPRPWPLSIYIRLRFPEAFARERQSAHARRATIGGGGEPQGGAASGPPGSARGSRAGSKIRRPQPMTPQGGGLPLAAHSPGPLGRTISVCTGPQISAGHPVHARGLQNARPVLPGAGQKRGAGLGSFQAKNERDPTGGAPCPLPCRGVAAADLPYGSGTPTVWPAKPQNARGPTEQGSAAGPMERRGSTGRMQNARKARQPPRFFHEPVAVTPPRSPVSLPARL